MTKGYANNKNNHHIFAYSNVPKAYCNAPNKIPGSKLNSTTTWPPDKKNSYRHGMFYSKL
jgi:hypothetical protein